MGEAENRATLEKVFDALQRQDMGGYTEAYAEDAVQEWPQSGERIVGRDNIKAVNDNYPGFPKSEQRRLIGSGDLWIGELTLNYDGDIQHGISVFEMRDGKIVRETDYFGAPWEAPEWRSQWVEKM
jgi:ketosteroid isomerase-like protein